MLKEIVINGVVIGSFDVPDGYDIVAFRPPLRGEKYVTQSCLESGDAYADWSSTSPRFILRKQFVWPEWVKPGTWYARDEDGYEILYTHKPSLEGNCWGSSEGARMHIDSRLFDFPKQQNSNWRESLMQKPLETK